MPVKITDLITPTAPEDTFPTHDSVYGKGGYREVDTLISRDAITTTRRKQGMLVYVIEDGTTYQLAANLTTWTVYNPGGGAPEAWQILTAAHTVVSGERLMCDTSGGAFTVTLPATPSAGATVTISDYANTFATNNLTVGRNASPIENVAEDLILDLRGTIKLEYVNATKGWALV